MDAIECIMTRRSSGRLVEPAPSAGDLDALLRAAMAGPDHGRLRPWRFVVVRGPGLERLGEVFAKAHAAREPTVPAAELERTRGKPLRAPLIVAVVSSPKPSPKVPRWGAGGLGRGRGREPLPGRACAGLRLHVADRLVRRGPRGARPPRPLRRGVGHGVGLPRD